MIFGGTTEGRILSHRLATRGAEITVCVATEYGREMQGVQSGITVLAGRKNQTEMESVLRGAGVCVDATHPYAVEASAAIGAACRTVGVPYRRLLRTAGGNTGTTPEAITVPDAAAAAAYLQDRPGNILLATGSRTLRCFSGLAPARLFPRVLPCHESLTACEAAGIPHRNILAMQGPFSRELNEAFIRHFHIAYLVTKDGGAEGGFEEKAQAARNTGARLILLRRPEQCGGGTLEEVAAFCEGVIACG